MPYRLALVGLMMCVLVGVGCTSTPSQIQTAPMGPDEVALGEASGSGTGVMLFWFIPIGQNDRFDDAYTEAIQVHPGTTRLINPTIKEQWAWGLILGIFSTEVSGTAVGPKK